MQLRTVFDSNMYIAAALRSGGHADLWLDIAATPGSTLRLFVSHEITREVRRTLIDRFTIRSVDVDRFVARIHTIATVVEPQERVKAVVTDPDDNAIIECAIAAQARLIISADHHLLNLNPYRGIGICHPRELKHVFAQDFRRANPGT